MKIKCINKERDTKGNIKYYNLLREDGIKFQATAKEIKIEMQKNNYEFTNLKIDKLGRLIDKRTDNIERPSISNMISIQTDIENSIKKLIQHLLNTGGFKFTYNGQIVSVNLEDIKRTEALLEKLKTKIEKAQLNINLHNTIYNIIEQVKEGKDIYFGYIGEDGLGEINLFISYNESALIDFLKTEYEDILCCMDDLDNMKVSALRSLVHTNIENKNFNSVEVYYEDAYLDQLNRALDQIEKEVTNHGDI
ncbi:MAG: hypothetical protein HDR05_12620 [Lachnospiraceae bacterium]|nr:hypothetical protein [Lachnospiraceae bacterium]